LRGGRHDAARILRPETVALMRQNQIGGIQAGIMKTNAPLLSNDVDFFPGMAVRWGLGNMINTAAGPNGRSAGSLTWAGLFNTYYWLDPVRGVAGLILTQILPFADPQAVALYGAFERAVYAALSEA
jgi:methyl acetate hydrolase